MQFYGAIRSEPDPRDHPYVPIRTRDVLPSTLPMPIAMPPVWDQAKAGTCVPHSVDALWWHAAAKAGLPTFTPSHLYLYYNTRKRDGQEKLADTGCSVRNAIKAVVEAGACAEAYWPYDLRRVNDAPATPANFSAAFHRPTIAHYSSLSVLRDETDLRYRLDDMKACLASGTPFALAFPITDHLRCVDFTLLPPLSLPAQGPGHCVVAVNYDDHRQAFNCRNSWGAGWGDQGHFWIRYEQATDPLFAFDVWTIDQWAGGGA